MEPPSTQTSACLLLSHGHCHPFKTNSKQADIRMCILLPYTHTCVNLSAFTYLHKRTYVRTSFFFTVQKWLPCTWSYNYSKTRPLWALEIILENLKYLHLRHNSHDPIWSSHHPRKPANLVCHLCLILETKWLVQGQVTTQKRTQSPKQESRELCYFCGAPGKEWCSDRLKNNGSLHISNGAFISNTVFVEKSSLAAFFWEGGCQESPWSFTSLYQYPSPQFLSAT